MNFDMIKQQLRCIREYRLLEMFKFIFNDITILYEE